MVYSLPAMEELSLTRITRSQRHAPDLKFSYIVPTADNDDNIPSPLELQGNLHLPTAWPPTALVISRKLQPQLYNCPSSEPDNLHYDLMHVPPFC